MSGQSMRPGARWNPPHGAKSLNRRTQHARPPIRRSRLPWQHGTARQVYVEARDQHKSKATPNVCTLLCLRPAVLHCMQRAKCFMWPPPRSGRRPRDGAHGTNGTVSTKAPPRSAHPHRRRVFPRTRTPTLLGQKTSWEHICAVLRPAVLCYGPTLWGGLNCISATYTMHGTAVRYGTQGLQNVTRRTGAAAANVAS